jgi:hypothetical protein
MGSSAGGRRLIALSAAAALAVVLLAAGCSSDESSPDGGTGSSATTTAEIYRVQVVGEATLDPAYRQGLARVDDGWIFSFNDGLFRTDDALNKVGETMPAIPAEWAAQGFNHVGDIDVVDGVVYAPVEQDDYELVRQAMFRYDAETLEFIDGVEVAQHHNAWVTVDGETGIAYSMDEFGDDAVTRYDTRDGWRPLEPLSLSTTIARVQGGDLRDGALWLSTDDETDGIYRVELTSGEVIAAGSMGRIEGEGEGIDATTLPDGDLHVISLADDIVTVWFIHLVIERG